MSTFSSQDGAPHAQISELDGKTHIHNVRYLGYHTADFKFSTSKGVYFQKFLQSLAPVVVQSDAQCHVKDRNRFFQEVS